MNNKKAESKEGNRIFKRLKQITPQEELRRKTENLASFLGCKPKAIEIWEQMEIDNEGIATYILSYDSIRLVITDIGESPSLHPMYWSSPITNRLKGCLGLSTEEQYIAMYGIEAYNKQKRQIKDWRLAHPEKVKEYNQKSKQNPNNKRKTITLLSGNDGDSHWGIRIQAGARTKTFNALFVFVDYSEARGRGYTKDIRAKNRLFWIGEKKEEQKLAIQVINRFGKCRKKKSYMK